MRIEVIQPELSARYDQYLYNSPCSLFYYCSKYKNFLRALLECQEEYFLAMEGSEIHGILPLMYMKFRDRRVYNSLPYYGSHGGILADNSAAYHELINVYLEITCAETTLSSTIITNPFAQQDVTNIRHNYSDYRIGQFTNLSLHGNQWDEIMARIDSSARRNVQKALRDGVTVEIDHTQMDRLRQMHQDNIRAVGGIPKTDEFFALVPRYFTPGHDFDLYIAKKDDIVIAGLLLFYFNKTVEYFTPAIESEYRSIQPLSLILITAMIDASRRGFIWWNWGGTWANQTGVYRFKKKWGAIERKYYYYTQLNNPSILDWSQIDILRTFPHFFVVPFSKLHTRGVQA